MKRIPIERRTPLVAKTRLTRTTGRPTLETARSQLHQNSATHRQLPKPARRSTGPSKSVLRLLAVRSEGLCEFWQCLEEAAHTHHRRPRRMGGSSAVDTNLASNLVRLCAGHHDFAESFRLKALELGLLLHASADPLRAPVLLRYGTVLLKNDGTWIDINNPISEEGL